MSSSPHEQNRWYAVRVRSRCEKSAASALQLREVEVMPAWTPQRRVWVDRVRIVDMPLFPGYVFARFAATRRVEVERVAGVASVVRFSDQCCPVDDREIESIRVVLDSGLDVQRASYLRVGKAVAVKHGPLAGAYGLVVEIKNRYRLVVSVSLLQRSVGVEIDEAMVEPIWSATEAGMGALAPAL